MSQKSYLSFWVAFLASLRALHGYRAISCHRGWIPMSVPRGNRSMKVPSWWSSIGLFGWTAVPVKIKDRLGSWYWRTARWSDVSLWNVPRMWAYIELPIRIPSSPVNTGLIYLRTHCRFVSNHARHRSTILPNPAQLQIRTPENALPLNYVGKRLSLS